MTKRNHKCKDCDVISEKIHRENVDFIMDKLTTDIKEITDNDN